MTRRNDDSANQGLFHDTPTSDAPLWPSFLTETETSLRGMRQAISHMTGGATTPDSALSMSRSGGGSAEPVLLAMVRPTERISANPLAPRLIDLVTSITSPAPGADRPVVPAPPVLRAPGADRPVVPAPPPIGADRPVVPAPPRIEGAPRPGADPAHPAGLVDRFSGNMTTLNWQPNGLSGQGSRIEIAAMTDSRGTWQRGQNSDRVLNDVWTNREGATWRGTVELRQGQLVETHIGENGAVLDTRTYNPATGRVTTEWRDQHFGAVVRDERSDVANANRHTIRFSGATVQVNNSTGEATWIDDRTQQRWQGRVQIQADGSPYFIQTSAAPVVQPRRPAGVPSPAPASSEVFPSQLFQSPCPNGQCPNVRPSTGRR